MAITEDTTGITYSNKEDIQKKIESLTKPGDTVFFYIGPSPNKGGPLGGGAAVVELNPNYPGAKQKSTTSTPPMLMARTRWAKPQTDGSG